MDDADSLAARLRANPADEAAYHALRSLYWTQGDFPSLVNLVAGWAGWTADDYAASQAYLEVGDVLCHQLGDAEQAVRFYREALRRDAHNTAALDALCAVWEAHGAFHELIEFLQSHVSVLQAQGAPPQALSVLRFRVGELWHKQLGRVDEALHHYRKAIDHDPGLTAAMYEARQLYVAQGDLRSAAEMLDRESGAELDETRKIGLLCDLAALHRDQLDDIDGAVSALQRAYSLAPGDSQLAYELASLLSTRAAGLDPRTAQGDFLRVADLMCGIAAAVEPARAVEYLESALRYVPDHEEAMSRLESLLEGSDPVRLADHWIAYLASAPPSRDAYRRRVKLARAYLSQGQHEDAVFALQPAADAGYAAALELMEELAPAPAADEPDVDDSAPLDEDLLQPLDEEPAASERPELGQMSPDPAPAPPSDGLELRDQPVPRGKSLEPITVDERGGRRKRRTGEQSPPDQAPLAAAAVDLQAEIPTVRADHASGRREPIPDDEHTEVSQRELIDSLREATAEVVAETAQAEVAPAPVPPPPEDDSLPAHHEIDEALDAVLDEPVADPREAIEQTRQRAAQLARERDSHHAAELYADVFQAAPEDREAFAFLDGHYRRTQDHRRRAELLVRSAQCAGLPQKTRVTRLREAASLYEARLKDPSGAVVAWQALGSLEPDSEDVQRALKRLLERAGRWDDLVALLEQEHAALTDDEARAALLRRLAGIHRERRDDLGASAATLQRLLELRPEDRATRDTLLEQLLALGRHADAVPLLEQKVEQARATSQRLPLLKQLAEIHTQHLGDREQAFSTYQRIVELAPQELWALDSMAALDEEGGDALRLLDTLDRKAVAVGGTAAAETYHRMALIAVEQLDDLHRAGDLLYRASQLAPHNPLYLDTLSSLYERAGRFDDLVELLRERTVMEQQPESKAELFRRLARVLGGELGDEEGAADAYQQVLALREDREALLALQQRAQARDDVADLAEILRRLAALEKNLDERRDRLFERAQLLLLRLSQPADAVADLVHILTRLDPDFEPALDLLSTASAETKDYAGLCEVLEQRLSKAEELPELIGYARQLAGIYEHHSVDAQRAIRVLFRWTEADPEDLEPRRRLCPLLDRRHRFKELIGTLDVVASLAEDAAERRDAAVRAAELCYEKFRDAAGAWQRLSPWSQAGDVPAQEAHIRLAYAAELLPEIYDLLENAGYVERLLALLHARVDEEPNVGERVALHRRIAHLQIDYRQDQDAAAEAYKRLLELQEDADALRFLQAWALHNDEVETLSDALRRLAALERDPFDRRDLLYEHARLLHTRLDQPGQAVFVLQEVLAIEPDYAPAVGELLTAAEDAEDYPVLAATLERVLQRENDLAQRAELAARLSDVYELRLKDTERAVVALARWAEAAPGLPAPHRRLRPLLTQLKRYPELLATLDALAASEGSVGERIEATVAAAELCRGKLGDEEGAWQRLSPLVAEQDEQADRALHELARDSRRLDELYALLEQAGRFETLVQRLREQAAQERDDVARVELYRRIARTLETHLDDEDGAAEAWSALLALAEDREALRFMHSRALRQRDLPAVADALKRLSAAEDDPAEQRDLLFEYAHLLNSQMQRSSEAIAVLRQVLERDSDFEPAIDELLVAAEAAGDDPTLAFALERTLAREASPEGRVELCRRLADLYEGSLDDASKAIRTLQRWAQAAEDDVEPHRRLVPLLSVAGQNAELLFHLDALGALEPDDAARREATLRAARLALDVFEDADGAWARTTPLAHRGDERAEAMLRELAFAHGKLVELSALYQAAGRYDDLAIALRERAEQETDPEMRFVLYRDCARVLGGVLDDEMAAAEAWRAALDVREDIEALAYLRGLAARVDDVEQSAELLGRMAAVVEDPADKRDLLFERALLLGDRLEQPQEAIAVLRYVVQLDPEFRPAIEELVVAAEAHDDYQSLCEGLTRQLSLAESPAVRAELASRLADLYENQSKDASRAAEALDVWCLCAPRDPEPHRRLRPYLEASEESRELLHVLDVLAACEDAAPARAEAAIAGARLSAATLGDTEGAWKRLAPLVLEGHEQAEREAVAVAKQAGLSRALANLYVLRAKQASDPGAAAEDWMAAARIYDSELGATVEALEACLRALASDLGNRTFLDEIERLAVQAQAWERLWRVYNRLVENASGRDAKIELLARHADLLEKRARDPGAALERVLEICKLAPERDDVLQRAERLAQEADSSAELLWICDNLYRNAQDPERKAQYLLRAARIADLDLEDREQAMLNLSRALEMTEQLPHVAGQIEDLARQFDTQRPELGAEDARRGLIQAHLNLAPKVGEPFGPVLVLRAAQLLQDELKDDSAAFDALKQGASVFSSDLDLYDALERAALKNRRLDALDAQLARAIARSDEDDGEVRIELMRRRGRLLSQHLQRHAKAAEVYAELLQLSPDNEQIASDLFDALKQAGRYQELLRAYKQRLAHVTEEPLRLSLLRQMASLWEVELKNRPSALEIWREVHALRPDDEEAAAALARLQHIA